MVVGGCRSFHVLVTTLFCSLYLVHKREDMVPAGLNIAETMDTGDIMNCGMTQELATNVL